MDDDIFEFKSAEEMNRWLSVNYAKSNGIWVRFFRKDSGIESVKNSEALEVALTYGWITGQARKCDEKSWLGRFTPRRPNSIWSKINTRIAERLIEEGKMKPPGLSQIEAAKKDGRWDRAYEPQKTATLPADFVNELKKHEKAASFFKGLGKSDVYTIIFLIETAKNEEQRRTRIQSIIEKLEKHEKPRL